MTIPLTDPLFGQLPQDYPENVSPQADDFLMWYKSTPAGATPFETERLLFSTLQAAISAGSGTGKTPLEVGVPFVSTGLVLGNEDWNSTSNLFSKAYYDTIVEPTWTAGNVFYMFDDSGTIRPALKTSVATHELIAFLSDVTGGTAPAPSAKGQTIYTDTISTYALLNIGITGQIYTVDATGVPVWANAPSGSVPTPNADGQLLSGLSGGTYNLLNLGTQNYVLQAGASAAEWTNNPQFNKMTLASGSAPNTNGEMAYASGQFDVFQDGSLQTLAVLSNFNGVTLSSSGASTSFLNQTGAYSVPAGGGGSPLTTNGDLYYYNGGDARFPIGTTGDIMFANAGFPAWVSPSDVGSILIGGGAGFGQLPISGVNGRVLTDNGTTAVWQAPATASTTYLTLTDTPSSYPGATTLDQPRIAKANIVSNAMEFDYLIREYTALQVSLGTSTMRYNEFFRDPTLKKLYYTLSTTSGSAPNEYAAFSQIITNSADEFGDVSSKSTPTTSDRLLIEDAASSNAKKYIIIGDLPSGGGATLASGKLLDQIISASTTLTDDTALFDTVEANEDYEFQLELVGTGGAGFIKTGWNLPSSSTVNFSVFGTADAATTYRTTKGSVTGTGSQQMTNFTYWEYGNANNVLTITGTIEVGGTGGTLNFQWAQSVASGSTTVAKGSTLKLNKIS